MAERKKYVLGDTQCLYFVDEENGQADLELLPTDMKYEEVNKENPYTDSLVQIHIAGDVYLGANIGGRTRR